MQSNSQGKVFEMSPRTAELTTQRLTWLQRGIRADCAYSPVEISDLNMTTKSSLESNKCLLNLRSGATVWVEYDLVRRERIGVNNLVHMKAQSLKSPGF